MQVPPPGGTIARPPRSGPPPDRGVDPLEPAGRGAPATRPARGGRPNPSIARPLAGKSRPRDRRSPTASRPPMPTSPIPAEKLPAAARDAAALRRPPRNAAGCRATRTHGEPWPGRFPRRRSLGSNSRSPGRPGPSDHTIVPSEARALAQPGRCLRAAERCSMVCLNWLACFSACGSCSARTASRKAWP